MTETIIGEAKRKTVAIDLYPLSELPPEIQEQIIQKNRDINVFDGFWYEYTLAYWTTEKLPEKGFLNARISFELHGQGSGVSFECKVDVSKFGLNPADYSDTPYFHRTNYRYKHPATCSMGYDAPDSEIPHEIWVTILERYTEACNELHKELSDEYDYLTSDEAIKEALSDNFYTKNGTLIDIDALK